jgi:hypothetical protein
VCPRRRRPEPHAPLRRRYGEAGGFAAARRLAAEEDTPARLTRDEVSWQLVAPSV